MHPAFANNHASSTQQGERERYTSSNTQRVIDAETLLGVREAIIEASP